MSLMKNWPCASETALAPLCSKITCAPTKAAPEASMTRPRIAPLPPCAGAPLAMSIASDKVVNHFERKNFTVDILTS